MKLKLDLILFGAALIIVGLLADAWRSARLDSQKLAVSLAAQTSIIQQAGDREQQRDKQLNAALAAIAAQKRAVRTPQQAAEQLASVLPPLPLPVRVSIPILPPDPAVSANPSTTVDSSPLVNSKSSANSNSSVNSKSSTDSESSLESDSESATTSATTTPASPQTSSTTITVPPADLLPLYDALQDCRSSTLQSENLQKDLSDEKSRSAALTRERDAAIAVAHGGTFQTRLKRAAKWFSIGAVAATATLALIHP